METIGLTLALLLLLGFACQWLAWRVKQPAILLLLIAGVLIGPVFGVIDPDALLGDLLFPFISLGVAVILFEGALTLRFEETRGIQRVIFNLVTVGVLITLLGMAAAARWIADLAWPLALLFGALVCVTGPTVIVPLLRTIKPTARVGNVLRWEGILIDPIGAILVVLVYELVVAGGQHNPALAFGELLVVGSVTGIAGAFGLAAVLERHWLPGYLENFGTLSVMLTVFMGANALVHESGLLAVTVMGIILANRRDLHVEDILDFKENLTVLLLSVLFLLLGARVDLAVIAGLAVTALALLAVAKLLVRPLSVAASAIGSGLSAREVALLAWIGPRGIVAAAVAALFEIRLQADGVADAELLVPLVFSIIIGTVVVESATARPLARLLGLSAADEEGVLLVGANRVSIAVGEALAKQGVRCVVVDTDYDGLSEARMKGLPTWFGSSLSDRADRLLDLTGLTHLFAMSRNRELNTLVCSRYRPEFGVTHTYTLLYSKRSDESEQHAKLAVALKTPLLFGKGVSWTQLSSQISKGWAVRATKLTPDFDFEAYSAKYPRDSLPLFALDASGTLLVYEGDWPSTPGPGWTICTLAPPKGEPVPESASADAPRLPDSAESTG